MAKNKKEKEYSDMEDLQKAWRETSDEQLLLMKYCPRGNSDIVFKRALNKEIKSRRLDKK